MEKTLDGLVIRTVAINVQRAVKQEIGSIGMVSQVVKEIGIEMNTYELMVSVLKFVI